MARVARTALSFGALPAVFVAVFLASSFQSASADTVKLTDGKVYEGVTVIEESFEGVKYRLPNVSRPQTMPAERVAKVEYGKLPNDYKEAHVALSLQDYDAARSLFLGAAQGNSRGRGWVKQYALFYAAECYRLQNKWNEAIKGYNELMTQVPKTRFYPDAMLAKAQCRLNAGNDAEAKKLIEQLASETKEKNFGDRWSHESNLFLIQMSEEGNPSRALNDYQALYAATQEVYPDVANKARLRIGYVYIKQGKVDEAKRYFEEIVDNRLASPDRIVAGAYNGLGVSIYNNTSATQEDLKEALYHFLRVVYTYGEVREEQAQALYWGGKIFSQLGGPRGTSRARLLLARCQSEFPGTQWAERASRESN